jgi:hypothetical protein
MLVIYFFSLKGPDGLPINEDETKINMEEYFGEDYEDYPEEYLPYQAQNTIPTVYWFL